MDVVDGQIPVDPDFVVALPLRRIGVASGRPPANVVTVTIGFMVGLVVGTWGAGVGVWRFGRIEERWSPGPNIGMKVK